MTSSAGSSQPRRPVTDGGVLLVNHINAGLWLPPGGHVEPDEHPAQTASREALEELGIAERPASFGDLADDPQRPRRADGHAW